MSLPTDRDGLRAELASVEESLRRLRGEEGVPGDRGNQVGDQADDASSLTGYEEEQALIENLEARRARITGALEKLEQ